MSGPTVVAQAQASLDPKTSFGLSKGGSLLSGDYCRVHVVQGRSWVMCCVIELEGGVWYVGFFRQVTTLPRS